MTLLEKPKLGTDPKAGWRYYSTHMAITYVLKEIVLVRNYFRCIELAIDHGEQVQRLAENLKRHGIRSEGDPFPQSNGLDQWAEQIKKEGFHEVYIHSFISLWSSFEAGIENIVADYVRNDKPSAASIAEKISTGKFQLTNWPWPEEKCLRAAALAEDRATKKTPDGKKLIFKRLQTLLSWVGIKIDINEAHQVDLAEANCVRNILLHRYGEVGSNDAARFPNLKSFVGKVVPFDEGRFRRYSGAVSKTLSAIMMSAGQKEKEDIS